MLQKIPTPLLAFTVGIVGLIGAIVLTATHTPVPAYEWAITGAALAGALGISVPNATPGIDVAALAEQLAPHVSIAAAAGAKFGAAQNAAAPPTVTGAVPVTSAVLPGS